MHDGGDQGWRSESFSPPYLLRTGSRSLSWKQLNRQVEKISVKPHTLVMQTVLKTKTKSKTIEIQKQNNSAYIHNFMGLFATSTLSVMHFVYPKKFCISIIFNFSLDLQSSQEKLKTMLMQNFWR